MNAKVMIYFNSKHNPSLSAKEKRHKRHKYKKERSQTVLKLRRQLKARAYAGDLKKNKWSVIEWLGILLENKIYGLRIEATSPWCNLGFS